MEGGDDPELRVGDVIADKYELLGVLGSGGMGAVFEAVHRFTGRRVAVKLMHRSLSQHKSLAERFVREARAPCSIGHSGIVDVLDGGHDTDGSLYLVLELLEGETLGDAIKNERLEVGEFCQIMSELLDALDAAHAAGFVHRDIKPDNVFLTREDSPAGGVVKLLDFGVVGILASESGVQLTQTGAVMGTPLYMSPEQAMGRKADARSDLWSIGAVMYRAFAQRPPFVGQSYNEVIVSVATGDYDLLSTVRTDLPRALSAVVDRALCKDPDERWQHAAQMAEALERAMAAPGARPAAPINDPHAPDAQRTVPDRPAKRPSGGVDTDADTVQEGLPGGATAAARPKRTPVAIRVAGSGEREAPRSLVWIWIAAAAIVLSAGGVAFGMLSRSPGEQPRLLTEMAAASSANADGPAAATTTAEPQAAGTATEPEGAEPQPRAEPGATEEAAVEADPPKGLSSRQLAQVVTAHQAQLKRCLQEATLRTRSVKPTRLDVELRVSPDGRVTRAEVLGVGPAGLALCVEKAVGGWRFATTNAHSELSFPLLFEPEIVEM